MGMWIDVAPAVEGGAALSYRALEQRVRAAWLGVARFTCTQLASGLLMHRYDQGQRATRIGALEAGVLAWARELANAGRQVDPALLSEEGARRRVAGYLTYAELRGILRHYGDSIVLARDIPDEIILTPGDVGYRYAPLRYAANEVREMAGAAPAQFDTLAM
jgi:hypothetical protein